MYYKVFNDSIETKCEMCGDPMLIFDGESAHMSKTSGFLCGVCQKGEDTVLIKTKMGTADLSEEQMQSLQEHIHEYLDAMQNMDFVCEFCNKTLVFGEDEFSIGKNQEDMFKVICRDCLENK